MEPEDVWSLQVARLLSSRRVRTTQSCTINAFICFFFLLKNPKPLMCNFSPISVFHVLTISLCFQVHGYFINACVLIIFVFYFVLSRFYVPIVYERLALTLVAKKTTKILNEHQKNNGDFLRFCRALSWLLN